MMQEKDQCSDLFEIVKSHVLVVEGMEDCKFFDQLIRFHFGDGHDIQLIQAEGIGNYSAQLQYIVNRSHPGDPRGIGIVRDADEDAGRAFESVRDLVRRSGLDPPDSHNHYSEGEPSVGIFIMPDGRSPGSIETLCRHSVSGENGFGCVETFIQCMRENDALESRSEDKTFVHAYLASRNRSEAAVGTGAQRGYWNFDSHEFDDLKDFLRLLNEK